MSEIETKYIVVTPARDEQEHIGKTISSVIRQTLLPLEWIIVNDGSKDDTGKIIDSYSRRYTWIRAIHRPDRGARVAGSGVMEAFYDGYNAIAGDEWDYIVKLDGDLTLDPNYFRDCIEEFNKDQKLGIAGGGIYHEVNGTLELEEQPLFHVRGATKIYRRKCWESIGGLIRLPGWDTIDEVHANMLGWKTRSFNHLKICHHRFTGAAAGSWRNAIKNGKASYISGYHPIFMFAKCIKHVFEKPYVVGACGLFMGYLHGYCCNTPQIDNKQLIQYIRGQQIRRLLHLKSIWR